MHLGIDFWSILVGLGPQDGLQGSQERFRTAFVLVLGCLGGFLAYLVAFGGLSGVPWVCLFFGPQEGCNVLFLKRFDGFLASFCDPGPRIVHSFFGGAS